MNIKDQVKLKNVNRLAIKKTVMAKQKQDFDYFSTFVNELAIHKHSARFYHLVYVVRRFIFIMLVINAGNYSWLQLQFFNVSCLFRMGFLLGSKPIRDKKFLL